MLNIDKLSPNRIGYKGKTNEQRFWGLVDIKSEEECWEWRGSKAVRYGRFSIYPIKITAHRYSYYLYTGYFPSHDEYICHNCDNVYCVNPSHLFLGNQYDNMRDMVSKGRNFDTKGINNGRCKVNELNVKEIRKLYSDGLSIRNISKIFDLGFTQTRRIINHESWAWLK